MIFSMMRPFDNVALGGAFVVSLFAAMTVGTDRAGAATIINGSFELGSNPGTFTTLGVGSTNITGWDITTGNIDYIGTYWQAADGSRSIDLNGMMPGAISQNITGLEIGKGYIISFDLAGNPDGAPAVKTLDAIVASVGTHSFSFDATGSSRPDMNWTTYSFAFTATATELLLSFASTIPGAFGPALDNVSIAETPLPAALPLFAGGLGMTLLLARRRKHKPQTAA